MTPLKEIKVESEGSTGEYLVKFSDEEGPVLGIEIVGEGTDTRLVMKIRFGCTDEDIVDLMNDILANPSVEIEDPD